MQMVRTLSDLVEQDVPTDTLCGECLKQHGLSVIVSTLAVSGAFFAGLFIAIPALRTFAIQVLPKKDTILIHFSKSDEKTSTSLCSDGYSGHFVLSGHATPFPSHYFAGPTTSFRATIGHLLLLWPVNQKKISWNYFFFFSFRIHLLPVFWWFLSCPFLFVRPKCEIHSILNTVWFLFLSIIKLNFPIIRFYFIFQFKFFKIFSKFFPFFQKKILFFQIFSNFFHFFHFLYSFIYLLFPDQILCPWCNIPSQRTSQLADHEEERSHERVVVGLPVVVAADAVVLFLARVLAADEDRIKANWDIFRWNLARWTNGSWNLECYHMVRRLFDWLIDCSIDWLFQWLMIGRSIDWLIDWFYFLLFL